MTDIIRNAKGDKGVINEDGQWVPIKFAGVTESLHQGFIGDNPVRKAKSDRYKKNKIARAAENRARFDRGGKK